MSYSKQETIIKQRKLVSKAQRNKRKVLVSIFKVVLVLLVAIMTAGVGAGFGMVKGILDNAPSIDDINIYPQGFKTVIYDQNGNQIDELSTTDSNRVYVYYEEIPVQFVNAFVAIEDERYWTHNGVDPKGILRAFVNGVKSGEFNQGASTITQQLIKNQAFDVGLNESTFMDSLSRKIQEQYLALELEEKYTKEQIVEYYLNTIYLGKGTHGIQAASQRYFGKDINELTVSEMSAIAGITQNPSAYDPILYPEASAKRRKMVLDKMLELEYINQAQYDEAIADNVYERIAEHQDYVEANDEVNTYYTDALINELQGELQEVYQCSESEASMMLYSGGLSIYSVQDQDIQDICDTVINSTDYYANIESVSLDYQLTLIKDKEEINYSTGSLLNYFKEKNGDSSITNIFSTEEAARAAADEFKNAKLEETGGNFSAERFVVCPQPQLSFTIMDQKTGYVKAIVGGRGEKTANRSLNRATDSTRQSGSTFKVLAAYIPLIDTNQGCLATPFLDAPYKYANGRPVSNWYSGYRGYASTRKAIADSMNICAVRAIDQVTPDVAFQYLLSEGFTTLVEEEVRDGQVFSDITQSCALGGLTDGITNLEITAAYASIANNGVYTKPVFYSYVLDHDGNVIVDHRTPETHQVMKATTSWQIIQALKSVVSEGTGTAARLECGVTVGGKTGTTSESYDLWFCGITPYYTASIWSGYDTNVQMPNGSTHSSIWSEIMNQVAVMEGQDASVDFPRPDGITSITLCQITGLRAGDDCPTFTDYCATDFNPEICTGHEKIEICSDSKCIATTACPNKVTFYAIEDEETGEKTFAGLSEEQEEEGYHYTVDVCTLHPELPNEFTLTSAAGPGGSISSSVTVEAGSNVTFFITPYNGYAISDVKVNGQSMGAVSSFLFEDVQGNGTIEATFTPVQTPTPTPTETTTQGPDTTE